MIDVKDVITCESCKEFELNFDWLRCDTAEKFIVMIQVHNHHRPGSSYSIGKYCKEILGVDYGNFQEG